MTSVAHADCIDDAASRQQVNAYVLRAIGWQESRLNPEALHRNANGTTDLGAFQINSIHFPALRRTGISSEALRDGCVCAYVAAWHYRLQVDRFGNTWNAVGAYHSTSAALNHHYANDIAAILRSWGVLPSGPPPFQDMANPRWPPRRPRSIGTASNLAMSAASPDPDSFDSVIFDSPVEAAPR